MDNIFNEQLVKKEVSSVDIAKKAGIIFLAVILSIVAINFLKQFGFIAAFGIIYGAYYLIQRTNLEFEYIFTNGDLDIDTIFSKSRRKRALSVNIKTFELVAQVNDDKYKSELNHCEKVLDYSSGKETPNTYAAIFSHDGKKTKMIFEPNEKILQGMKHYIPRKLKWRRYS